jgi:antitoxin component YwqK of YwqJK toxin-antitoxin module
MRQLFTLIFILISGQIYSQKLNVELEDTSYHLNLDREKTYYASVDLSDWENLSDSGKVDNNGLKQGKWIEYPIDTTILKNENNIRNHPDKKEVYEPELVKAKGTYLNDKKTGKWKFYIGKNHGLFTTWQLDKSIEYKNGKKHGAEIHYNPYSKDTLIYREYKKDRLNGISKVYDFNGNLKMIAEMKNGKENGTVKKYYPNGQLEYSCEYENGVADGVYRYYDKQGNLIGKAIYEDGQKKNKCRVGKGDSHP